MCLWITVQCREVTNTEGGRDWLTGASASLWLDEVRVNNVDFKSDAHVR